MDVQTEFLPIPQNFVPTGFKGQLEESKGQLEGSKDPQVVSGGQLEGSQGHPLGSEGQPEGSESHPGGRTYGRTDGLSPYFRQ